MALTAKPFKPKARKCKACPCIFVPAQPMQSVCSPKCASVCSAKRSKPKQTLSKDAQGVEAHIIDGDERFVEQTEDRHAARAARQAASARETKELILRVGLAALVSQDESSCAAIEKDGAVEHKGYQKLVAALPCSWCGIYGRSNHAHENGVANGKGLGIKLDDRRAMPLCVDDMGKQGCHAAFDQYALIDGGREAHVELGKQLANQTRQLIRAAGKWPRDLPVWQEQ